MKAPGVAFVSVADDVLRRPRRLGDRVPFEAGRVARAAATAEAAAGQLLADLARGRGGKDVPERLITASLHVVLEAFGIDRARVLCRDPNLAREERLLGDGRRVVRDLPEGGDDVSEPPGRHVTEELAGLGDLHEGAGRAEAEAADALDRDIGPAGLRDLLTESEEDVVALG